MQNTIVYGKIADNGYQEIVRRISEAQNPSVTEGAPKVRKIKIIGLTGRSGSGKGYVCDRFLSFGIPSIDTDRVYRDITAADEVMRPCTAELCAAFGKQIVSADNSLDRKVLAEAVFTDSSKLALLNSITHKYILGEVRARISALEASGIRAVIVDAPVLFESGFDRECDVTVAVRADEDKRVARIVGRDGISEDGARRRLASQAKDDELCARVDFTIENNGDDSVTDSQIASIVDFLFHKAK